MAHQDYPDYLKTRNNSQSEMQRCFSDCPKRFCQMWNYRIDKTITEQPIFTNMSEFWNGTHRSKISFYVEERRLKVIEEQVIYGLNQLIGEVGGTWGFYLGFSVVNALFTFGNVIATTAQLLIQNRFSVQRSN
jgi:hypothetical protein